MNMYSHDKERMRLKGCCPLDVLIAEDPCGDGVEVVLFLFDLRFEKHANIFSGF